MPDETNTQPEQNQTEESTVQQSPRPDDSGAVEAQAATHAAEDSPPGQKIQIGSRRKNAEGGKPRGAKPHVGGKAPAIPAAVSNKGPVPVPSVRDNLPQDLEDEIAAALEGESIDDLMEQSTPVAAAQVETDDRRRATVIRIDAKHLFVSLSSASEGVISLQVFTEIPEVGSEIDVIVTGFNEDDQIYEVTVPGAAVSVADWSDLQEGAVIDVTITGSNVGGLECQVNSIRGFIPASQI